MSILKYKYKAHRLVNTLFYVIVFVIGFLLGFSTEKIDFSKLMSQVLMIDNVQAYTIYEDDEIKIDEEHIYNKFVSLWEDFDIKIYNNIFCQYDKVSTEPKGKLECYAFTNETINNMFIPEGYQSIHFYSDEADYYRFKYEYTNNEFTIFYLNESKNSEHLINNIWIYPNEYNVGNFNAPHFTDEQNSQFNVLDFGGTNLTFNENLFKDNPDFKEVCVNKQDTIAITRTDNPENLDYMTDYDYIWFPYGINNIKSYNYHNADLIDNSDLLENIEWSSDNIFEYDDYSATFYKDKSVIDTTFNDENKGGNLKYKGYTDKYSYYGWTSALFNLWFDYRDGNNFNFIPIFEFEDSVKLDTLDGIGAVIPNLGFDNDIKNDNKICFYIKNDYSVTIVNKDEFNDLFGKVPTQNGDFNFTTSQNKNNISSGGLMSQVNKFIQHISGTINFIKDNIYSFYLSLPLLVRLFFISVFVILIVKFIIGMVVR